MNEFMESSAIEQDYLKKYYHLLHENGMDNKKNNVEELLQYIAKMTDQFDTVLNELSDVRGQLEEIQDKGIKATAIRVVDHVETKIQDAKVQLYTLKDSFMDTIKNAVNSFKDKGVLVLVNAVQVASIKPMLLAIKENLNDSITNADHGIDKLTKIGDEIHAAKDHTKNIGRVMIGKEVQPMLKRNSDKGIIYKFQELMFHRMESLNGTIKGVERFINKVESLEKKADGIHMKKASVRDSLQGIKDEKSVEKPKIKKEKER